MIAELKFAVLVAAAILVGLHIANLLYDEGVVHWRSRKIGHLAGAGAYLGSAYMFSSWHWPVVLSGGFVLILLAARILAPDTFRGVGGTARPGQLSEIWYPVSGTLCLIVGWGVFDRPFETVAAICMMGAGDAVTGIVRSQFTTRPEKHWSGSVAMFFVCLLLAWVFITPMWAGALVALAATATEWACGDVSRIRLLRRVDDNLAIPLVSLGVMLAALA